MPTSSGVGTSADAAPHVRPVAALVVSRGDPDGRRAVAKLAQARGWNVAAVHEVGPGDVRTRVLPAAHGGGFAVLGIPSLSILAPAPAAALGVLAALTDLGIVVESAEEKEGWVAASQQAVACVARWLDTASKEARAQKIRASMARSGRKPGRPRRVIPTEAESLVAGGLTIGACSRTLGVPESSLRRWLAERHTERRIAELANAEVA